jgi:hypothetical protein
MSDPFTPDPPPPPDTPIAAAEPAAAPPRRRTGAVVGALAVALALVAGTLAFLGTRGGDSAQARPLALSFEAGQSETYAIAMTMDGDIESDLFGSMPMQMELSEVMTWRVASVDDDGTATIEIEVSEVSGSVNGAEVPTAATSMPPIEIVVAPDGRILSAGGMALGGAAQTQGFGFPGMGQLTPILPDGPVEVGDTWTKHFSQDFPFGEGTIEYSATSTYERDETVDGHEAAVIVTSMSVPMDFSFSFAEMIDALGEQAAGATGVDALRDATVEYAGRGDVEQTSFVDLRAQELLRMNSAGDFDIRVAYAGIPGFEGDMRFSGTFTQDLERR